jgi:hypothetical protein
MVLLLVRFEEHGIEDGNGLCVTMGFNNFDNNGEDEWFFAGWNWTYDTFTNGKGDVVGWWPLITPEISK